MSDIPASKFQEKDRVRYKKDGLYYYVLKKSFQASVGMWLYWIAPKYRDILFAIGSECVWEDELEPEQEPKHLSVRNLFVPRI